MLQKLEKIVTSGSVTGVGAMGPVQLTNRFQPSLLMTSTDDVCSSQSRLTDQTKNILMGKNETRQLEGDSKNSSNIITTQQQSASGCVPKIATFQQPDCTDQPLLAIQSKNKLVGKK